MMRHVDPSIISLWCVICAILELLERTWRRLACTSRRISRPARPGWCSKTHAPMTDSGTSPLCFPGRRGYLSPSLQTVNAGRYIR